MQKHSAYVVIFEGIDACGKTTLAHNFYDHLVSYKKQFRRFDSLINLNNVITFPNYQSVAGEIIKTLINKELDQDLRKVLAAAFALDRMIYNYPPTYNSSSILILNRFYPSNFAYNYELDLGYLTNLEHKSFVGNEVFILDIDPETSFERRPDRRDNYEKDLEYLGKVRKRYLELAHKFGWKVLDGNNKPDILLEEVIAAVCNSNDGLNIVNV